LAKHGRSKVARKHDGAEQVNRFAQFINIGEQVLVATEIFAGVVATSAGEEVDSLFNNIACVVFHLLVWGEI